MRDAFRKLGVIPWYLIGLAGLVGLVILFAPAKKRKPDPDDLLPHLTKPERRANQIPPEEREKSVCYATYENLLRDGVLDVRVVFGYKDARPARYVGDRYERAIVMQYLLGACREGFFACGFERRRGDADVLEKDIISPSGRRAVMRLTVVNSSVGADDEENRERDSFQAWQSAYAERTFLSGLAEADVVFYNGHSRDGGGPDFSPPRLTRDDHVNYYWYLAEKPGLKKMAEALERASGEGSERATLLGVFSCVSDRLFAKKILQAAKGISLITSPKLIYYTEALRNLIGAISALAGQYCEADFRKAIRADVSLHSRLEGFFADSDKTD